jgi:hypothetical protein
MDATVSPLKPLKTIARQIGVPAAWLRREADAGRVPFLRIGRRLLGDAEAIRKLIADRSKGVRLGE